MNKVKLFILNRNFILILSLILAFLVPIGGKYIAPYSIYLLGLVMSFSTTSINLKMLTQIKSVSKIGLESILLNFIIHGLILLIPAYFLTDTYIFYGFVIIAATPPGAAVIPFTYIYKGDIDYSFKGILVTYLSSIILTPLIITFFIKDEQLETIVLIDLVLKVIVAPLVISRFLLIKKIKPITEKIRGKVVNIGFAVIIYTAISLNIKLIINSLDSIIITTGILIVAIFLSTIIFTYIFKDKIRNDLLISKSLLLSVKSSGFAIATSLALFDHKEVAVPAAIMSILVLCYLIFTDFYFNRLKII